MDERGPEPWRERYAHPCAWDQTFPPLAMTDLFVASVIKHGDAPLADFYGRLFSYNQMLVEARSFAAGLPLAGIGQGMVGLTVPTTVL